MPVNRAFIIVRKCCLSVVSVFHGKNVNQFISRENMIPAVICGVGIVLVVKFIVPVSFKKLFVLFFSKIFLEIWVSYLVFAFVSLCSSNRLEN